MAARGAAAYDPGAFEAACRERAERPPAGLAAAYATAKAQVLAPLLATAGFDRLVWAASASAPMSPEVVRFWAGFGVVIMDAWGLTETVGVATTNAPGAFRLGSAGRPLAGLEVRTAADGESEVRGRTVTAGYLRADGTVEPDGRSYLVALVVLDPEPAPAWAARHGIEGSLPEPARHPAVRAEVERGVAAANAGLNRTEQVKRFSLLGEEWRPETGELTPSLKLCRRVIRHKCGQMLERM